MPTPVANLFPFPATPPADALQTTRGPSRTESTEPFQTALDEARTGVRPAQPADNIEDTPPADAIENEADEAASELAGALVAVTQGVVPNDSPINLTEAELRASGQVIPDALNGINPELDSNPTAPPTRSNPLFRQFVSDASARNNTQLTPPVTQDTPPAPPTPVPVRPQTAAPATPPVPPAPTELELAVAFVQPAQRQVVPVVSPLVAGSLPNALPVSADDLPDPIVAPQAAIAASGLPSASLGDRPATAGEQFAEIASAAQTLVAPSAPAATSFAKTAVANAESVLPTPPTDATTIPSDAERDEVFSTSGIPGAPAPNAPTTRAAVAVQPAAPAVQVADAIVTHASAVERGGVTEFRMRLDPPELGPVRVRLIASGDSIHGQVVVSDDAIRRMIESQLPELRQRLEAAGVTVQSFDVTTDANTGGGRNGYRTDAPADPVRAVSAPEVGPRPSGPRAAGVLDVTV